MDNKLILVNLILVLFLSLVNGICNLVGKGVVCNDDLTGYFQCDEMNSQKKLQLCPSGTMCACGISRVCPTDGSVCIERPPTPFKLKSFYASFTGKSETENPKKQDKEVTFISGRLWQNFDTKSLFVATLYYVHGKFYNHTMETTRKVAGYPDLVKFTVATSPKDGRMVCTAQETKTFGYFHNLNLFYRDHNNTNEYIYFAGPYKGSSRKIIAKYKFPTKHNAPIDYTYHFDSDSHDEPTVDVNVRFDTVQYTLPSAYIFEIYKECKNITIDPAD